ncbi:MAG: hypothetical protein PUJ11_06045 [Eubacteriaceae bacterium]|nr:hypothetical protein [Eubacteriaceae bacterium]
MHQNYLANGLNARLKELPNISDEAEKAVHYAVDFFCGVYSVCRNVPIYAKEQAIDTI